MTALDETAKQHPAGSGPVAGDRSAYLLLSVALVALGLASSRWLLVAPFFAPLLLHSLLARRIRLHPGIITYLVLSVPYSVLYRTWGIKVPGHVEFDFFNFAFYGSLYLLTIAVVKLYSVPDSQRLPRVFFCSAMVFGMAGIEPINIAYPPLLAVVTVASLLTMRTWMRMRYREELPDPWHRSAIAISFAFVIFLTIMSALLANLYYPDVRSFLFNLVFRYHLPTYSAGFSDTVRLGSIMRVRGDRDEEIAIRGYSKDPPGYLRGNAFTFYRDGTWSIRGRFLEERPQRAEDRATFIGRYVLPGRSDPTEEEKPTLALYPSASYSAHFFLPLSAAAIDTQSHTIIASSEGILTTKYTSTAYGYDVFLTPLPLMTRGRIPSHLVIPPNRVLVAALDYVIQKLSPRKDSPLAKVLAIRDYMRRHYTYGLEIEFLPTTDPLVQFLTQKDQGHCELFASAGTLLLRRMGVPARYVTGFFCEEPGPLPGHWIARRKHAHAWVEYFDPDQGWQTAEFTPEDGRPSVAKTAGQWAGFKEYFKGALVRLRRLGITGLTDLLIEAVGNAGLWLIGAWWRILTLTLFAAAFFLSRFWWSRRMEGWLRRKRRKFPEEIETLRRAFFRLQKNLARLGFQRGPGETLEEYASRVEAGGFENGEEVARFIRELSARRYAPFD
ncbi:MAG: transglutaminase-like domain-containing protein [Planctomycetota bacterium]